jgi:branched-chain amino acid aminotransferase
VRTPDRGVLEGISRKTVIELCGALGIPIRVEPVPAAALAAADEVFLSSTGGGVLPIARVDGRSIAGWPGR